MNKSKDATEFIGDYRKLGADLRRLQKQDEERREREGRRSDTVILNPNDVHGDYDVGRLLKTTLGGQKRSITPKDLLAFKKNIETLGKRFKRGGITASQVIDLSREIDIKRANEEIQSAFPRLNNRGQFSFVTNASHKHGARRHHVSVIFHGFEQLVNDANKDAKNAAKEVIGGRISFDCDCGRHTFWYRYMATVGGYNAGRPETGFPKVRNPDLAGCACKHVLRVMERLKNGADVSRFVAQAILAARKSASGKEQVKLSKEEALAIVKAQSEAGGSKDVSRSMQGKVANALRKAFESAPAPKARTSKLAQSTATKSLLRNATGLIKKLFGG